MLIERGRVYSDLGWDLWDLLEPAPTVEKRAGLFRFRVGFVGFIRTHPYGL
jgi:hypothetical protein